MAHVETKMITLPDRGPIYPKGGIMGPIVHPFKEHVKTIGLLLMRSYRVNEVLEDGSVIKLDLTNFDKDNNPEVAPVVDPTPAPTGDVTPDPVQPVQVQRDKSQQNHKNQNRQQQKADQVTKK